MLLRIIIPVLTLAVCNLSDYAEGGVPMQLSASEQLTYRLATEDLSSEKHALPSKALAEFSNWTAHILKDCQSHEWIVRTVAKPKGFEFIYARANALIIRQVSEVFMVEVPVDESIKREKKTDQVLEIVKKYIKGDWDKTILNATGVKEDVLFLRSTKTFQEGTSRDSFVALVFKDRICIAVPKKTALWGTKEYSFCVRGNSRWFAEVSGNK